MVGCAPTNFLILNAPSRDLLNSLVGDCVFRDPEIPVSENPLDLESGRLAGTMTPQDLQIASPD
jgi:hypothetical protein